MSKTLEKIRLLERYLASDQAAADPLMDTTIDKLLAREIAHAQELKTRLENQIAGYEKRYQLNVSTFYRRYQDGEMGDDMDFVEWAATVEMLDKARERLALLQQESTA